MKALALVLLAMLCLVGSVSACGTCLPMGADGSMLCVSMASETGCVSVCDQGYVNCVCAANPCVYGPPRDPGIVTTDEGKPEPVTKLTPFKGLNLEQMAALCSVTPGCTMFSDNLALHGPTGVVAKGPMTWGGIKAFYR
jgi:hypothetical protein